MTGECDPKEVIDIISQQYGKISKGVLWNFFNGSNANLSQHDMLNIAQTAKKFASHKKTAYVGPTDLEFGILRMYEIQAESFLSSPSMRVFRDRSDALDWINSD